MNDRFKFRGITKGKVKKFVYGSLLWYAGEPQIWDKDGKNYIVEPKTVQLCTGLKDKNGKLIYEGDIVKCGKWDLASTDSFRDDEYIEQIGVINYYQKTGRFVVNRTTIPSANEISLPETCLGVLGDCYIEVIGNIYENKELLESEG